MEENNEHLSRDVSLIYVMFCIFLQVPRNEAAQKFIKYHLSSTFLLVKEQVENKKDDIERNVHDNH